jgi:leucyl-tRNA synthetase
VREPFKRYLAQGMIRMDGTKMSKSKGNLISPEHYYETVGADGLRLFHLFVGPPFDDMDWSDQTEQVIEGCGRFLDRLWRTSTTAQPTRSGEQNETDTELRQVVHRTIADVTKDIERWSYNTAVAHCMELLNAIQRYGKDEGKPHEDVWNEAIDSLLLLLAPLTPHLTAEIWQQRHPDQPSVHLQSWPGFDPDLVRQDVVTMVVQVNGKVREKVDVEAGIGEAEAEAIALGLDKVVATLDGRTPQRVVARPPRLVNIVV